MSWKSPLSVVITTGVLSVETCFSQIEWYVGDGQCAEADVWGLGLVFFFKGQFTVLKKQILAIFERWEIRVLVLVRLTEGYVIIESQRD
jgi:hypothetical protein